MRWRSDRCLGGHDAAEPAGSEVRNHGKTTCRVGEVGAEPACLHCGGGAFTWGLAYGRAAVGFLAGETAVERFLHLSPQRVRARRCDDCGHVELFAPLRDGE